MIIRFEPVKKDDIHMSKIKELYHTAFPASERIPFRLALLLAKKDFAEFLNIYDGDLWVGIIFLATDKDLTAVLYFAVAEAVRSKGYGGAILEAVRQRYSKNRILLFIEVLDPKAENYDQRVRRKRFYQRNGYNEAGILSKEGTQCFEGLSIGGTVKKEEYGALMKRFFGPFISFFIKPVLFDKEKS